MQGRSKHLRVITNTIGRYHNLFTEFIKFTSDPLHCKIMILNRYGHKLSDIFVNATLPCSQQGSAATNPCAHGMLPVDGHS